MPNRYATDSIRPLVVHTPWDGFGRVSMLQRWVAELMACQTAASPTKEHWRLIGRAVMIAHPDKDQHLELVAKVASEAGMNLIELGPDEFVAWVTNNEVPVNRCPALVYVPLGDWSEKSEEKTETIVNFRNALPAYLAGIDPNVMLVFITSGSSYANLDPELRTVGVFDRRFDVPSLTIEELGTLFLKEVGPDLCNSSLTADPCKVGRLIQIEFNEKRRYGLIALSMRRLARRENRKLTFDDLVHFSVFGGGEGDYPQETDPAKLERVAIHEAGHAIVSILDSEEKNIPDYVGIVSNDDFHGYATESIAFNQNRYGHYTFRDSCHKIRVALAGRAAEAVVLGPENVSTYGARSDLIDATNWAKELMGKCGFAQAYRHNNPYCLNLAVVDDEATPSQAAHIENQVRFYLTHQYEIVEKQIRDNIELFNAIKDRLLEKRVLTQADLQQILSRAAQQQRIEQ